MLYVKYKCRNCDKTFKESYRGSTDGDLQFAHSLATHLMMTPGHHFETHDCERDVVGVADVIGITEEPYNENYL